MIFTHTHNDCPLRQAAYCSVCACKGHFTSTCANKPKAIATDKKPIKGIPAQRDTNVYILPDDNKTYIEFLKVHEVIPSADKAMNRLKVDDVLKKRGYSGMEAGIKESGYKIPEVKPAEPKKKQPPKKNGKGAGVL